MGMVWARQNLAFLRSETSHVRTVFKESKSLASSISLKLGVIKRVILNSKKSSIEERLEIKKINHSQQCSTIIYHYDVLSALFVLAVYIPYIIQNIICFDDPMICLDVLHAV
jgi:spermidine synthase